MNPNRADFALTVDGADYASAVIPRLESLQLTEQIEGGADQLEVTLSNHDGRLAPIKRGVYATLSLGWRSGPDVIHGLVDKGRFLIDQIVKEGPPDTVRITGRSADLTGAMRRRRDKGWQGKTIGEIVAEVARANALQPRVHPDLAGIALPSAEQAAKSDIAFVRDLGRRYDAIATVKGGSLLFLPIGADTNASGQAIEGMTLRRRGSGRYTFTIADREEHDGAEAQWHDRGAARKRTVKEGAAKNPRRIKRSFGSEAEAKAAAKAEARRAGRGQFTLSVDLALGDPTFEPNRKITVEGFDSEIDSIRWLVTRATHRLDGRGGFTTALEMDSLA
jgi:phage protein D